VYTGRPRSFTYDTDGQVNPGDYLVAIHQRGYATGTCYHVLEARLVERKTEPEHPENPIRWYLTVLRVHPKAIPADACVHALVWNRRRH
jgi:hypothetical protein